MANDLKMEVVLQAIDRATRPIRAITQGSVGLGRALKESRDQLKVLQGQQRDVSSWRTLRAASEQTGTALQAARDRVKSLGQDLAGTSVPTRQMTRDLKAAIREATRLKQQHQEQQVQLQGMRNKLNSAGISTRNLGQHERDLRQRIVQANQAISDQTRRMDALSRQARQAAAAKQSFEKTQSLAGSMAANGAGTAAAGAAMGAPVLGAVKSYMSFEDAMLGVAKQVEGARDDNGVLTATYYEMGDAIKAMAERIPMATTDIAALVEGAARMGVQGKENLLSFAEVAANAATAFELPADAIGENLARIADLYKIPIKNVSQLGDAINFLDDNAKSKGADIIDVLQRTAGITASVGMSYKDAAALGSTFLTLGATAETAGTATNAMIRELAIATQQPKRFQSGLKALGVEAQALQDGMATDSTGTILKVLDAINRLPKKEQLGVATELFGKEFGDDASKLAQNIGEYRRQLELANSTEGDGSMQREADIRAAAMSAKMDMAKNRAFNLAATLGETLRPTLVNLVESFNSVIGGVTGWVKANPALTGQIIRVVAGVAVLATSFGAVALAMASLLGPFAMVRYALTLFGIKSLGAVTAFKSLGTALLWVGKAILFIGRALLMNPIGLAVMAIAGAAFLIYTYWEPIKAFFLSLWTQIQAGFSSGLAGILGLIHNFSPIGLFYSAFAAVMNYFNVELPTQFTGFGGMLIDGLISGITGKLGAVKEAITGAGESTIGWFKEKLGIHSPSRVFAELGGYTMAGLEQGLAGSQSGPLGAVKSLSQQLTEAGAFAMDGGAQSMTMDNRPPLSAAPGGGQSAGASGQAAPIVINVHPAAGMDEQTLARLVAAEVAKIQRTSQARSRSALSDGE